MNPHDIKALLGKRGIRQNKLAANLKVSPSLVTGVIYRKAKSRRVAKAICRAVNRPMRELFPELTHINSQEHGAAELIQLATAEPRHPEQQI